VGIGRRQAVVVGASALGGLVVWIDLERATDALVIHESDPTRQVSLCHDMGSVGRELPISLRRSVFIRERDYDGDTSPPSNPSSEVPPPWA
jgi:hypothetical protein